MSRKGDFLHCPKCGHRFIYHSLAQPPHRRVNLAVVLIYLTVAVIIMMLFASFASLLS